MDPSNEQTIDVRQVPRPERHPRIFECYSQLAPGGSLVLLADHEPANLRDEFDRDHPGTHSWRGEQLPGGEWQIRVSKLASTPAPRVLANTAQLANQDTIKDLNGAIWKLEPSQRDLDANIIALSPEEEIGEHTGPELDVLIHVISGGGILNTETQSLDLSVGDVLYLPARSRRHFIAGRDGLRYLSVHQRKRTLGLMPTLRR